jgi:hypothetical protein
MNNLQHLILNQGFTKLSYSSYNPQRPQPQSSGRGSTALGAVGGGALVGGGAVAGLGALSGGERAQGIWKNQLGASKAHLVDLQRQANLSAKFPDATGLPAKTQAQARALRDSNIKVRQRDIQSLTKLTSPEKLKMFKNMRNIGGGAAALGAGLLGYGLLS